MTRPLLALLALLSLAGCGGFTAVADNLTDSLLEQTDPETVEAGAPAYLLLIDGLIRDDPHDEGLLRAGSRLYAAYAGVFVRDNERARRLTARARSYAERALCEHDGDLCGFWALPIDGYRARLATLDADDVPVLFDAASAWAGWIQARASDWGAVAELPKVRTAMERVVELDEHHQDGAAHLYLGIMSTLLPPALGGKPDTGRAHFERALELSQGRDLRVKVEYARRYARLVYDRPLHDRLLNEVLAAPVEAPGLTLGNTLAQREARALLKSADSYF